MLGFAVGDVRSVSEAINDSVSTGGLVVLNETELKDIQGNSHFAAAALEAGIRSVLALNCRNEDDEIVAQVWICSTDVDRYTDLEVGFVSQISDHLNSAVINARNSESVKQLQRYLVGQNERFAQMQDGIESTEGELRLSHQLLTELNESKTQFMSEVAHEIKSPLAVMIGYADLLRFDVENLSADQREFATSIETAARQLTVLIDDLSDIAKIETGHFTTSKESHDVLQVVNSVVDGLRVSSSEYARRLRWVSPIGDFSVDGDPSRLSQVFTNLITNALKYSDENEFVEVSTMISDGRVQLLVADRGLGISTDDMDLLFSPYFRSTNPEAKQRPGTGLGLFLSKSIVEEHGGNLTVSSRMGIGSTFTVELPALAVNSLEDAA